MWANLWRLAGRLPIAVVAAASLLPAARAGAVTMPGVVEFPPTQIHADSTITVTFAADPAGEAVGAATIAGDPSFTVGANGCSGRAVVGTCTIEVVFGPSAPGDHSAILRLAGAGGAALVLLEGTAYADAPRLDASTRLLSFAPVPPDSLSPAQQVVFTAAGGLPTVILDAKVEGTAAGDFVITRDGCGLTRLDPGESCAVDVRVIGGGVDHGFARVRLVTAAPTAPVTIGLAIVPLPSATGSIVPRIPWSFGVVGATHADHHTVVRLYASVPARVVVRLVRGGRVLGRSTVRLGGGLVKPITIKGRLRHGSYRVRAVATHGSESRPDSLRFRVR